MVIYLTECGKKCKESYNITQIRYIEERKNQSVLYFGTKYSFAVEETGEYIQNIANEVSLGEFVMIHLSADGTVYYLNAFDIDSIEDRSGCAYIKMKTDGCCFLTSDSYSEIKSKVEEVFSRESKLIERYRNI